MARGGASPVNRSPRQDHAWGWGWRLLVPGWAQWSWRQPERAVFFFGSFLTAMAVALFAWGTTAGYVVLAAAFGMHVAAAGDAISQWAFPGFGRLVPLASAGAGLGLGCYAPAVALATVLAWPCHPATTPGQGFLVNRWAYHDHRPETGDWVWYDIPGRGTRGIGRVLGEGAQRVQWSDEALRVAGTRRDWRPPPQAQTPAEVVFVVPEDQYLVAPLGKPAQGASLLGLVLVDRDAIEGRPWARHFPVWSRTLLR